MAGLEKEIADIFGGYIVDVSAADDIFSIDDSNLKEPFEDGVKNTLGGERDIAEGINTDVDLILCIDVTISMKPIIDTVKGMALSLYSDIVEALAQKRRRVNGFRVKVISFRDYYCDIELAMNESRFFNLPAETAAFHAHVLGLEADGGGDEPENALEAIALAMKSDWVQAVSSNERARNIIVVFTDASAHKLEKSKDGIPQCYPVNMLTSFDDFKLAWENENSVGRTELTNIYGMDKQAKRLLIYSPLNSYPWKEMSNLTYVKTSSIEPARGGQELDRSILLEYIAGSIQ